MAVFGRTREAPSGDILSWRWMRDHSATLADVDAPPLQLPLIPSGIPLAAQPRTAWRLVLAAVLAAVPLLCVGGLFIGFHLYDDATRPDRGTPAVTVQNYLQAV